MNLLASLLIVLLAQTTPRISDQIVVTASELPETLESTPASVTVVTRKDIEQQAARDVADVLREVPGLTISRSGSPGKDASLFTRGGASTQTLVLWNGIEINNPYFAGYDWGRFSTAGVQQIEVVRGPFSALYGSDAMTGVVNILTTPRSTGIRAEVQGGGHGLRNALVDASYTASNVQLSALIEHRQDEGFSPNDDFRQNNGSLFVKWMPLSSFSLGLAARHTTYDLGIPFDINLLGSALVSSPKRRQDGSEHQLSVPIQQTLGRFTYDLTLSESRRNDNFHDPEDPFGFNTSNTDSSVRRARLVTRTSTAAGTVVVGGEGERAAVDDSSSFGVNLAHNRRNANAAFVEDRWSHDAGSASRIELSAGVRYDHFSTFGGQTSPRFAVAWIDGNAKLRAAYGEGFRAPSIGELFFPFAGNINLRPEHSHSMELGYDAALRGNGLLSLTVFRSRFRDLIVFDNESFAFANVGRVRTDGLEAGLQERLSAAFDMAVSYTFLRRNIDEATGESLPRRPKHSGSLLLGWHRGAMDTNLLLVRTGSRADILPIAPYSRVFNSAYTTLDVNAQLHAGSVTPFVKVENLRNARYQEVLGYESPGRRLIVGVRVGGAR